MNAPTIHVNTLELVPIILVHIIALVQLVGKAKIVLMISMNVPTIHANTQERVPIILVHIIVLV
jgi:hypothetical protein